MLSTVICYPGCGIFLSKVLQHLLQLFPLLFISLMVTFSGVWLLYFNYKLFISLRTSLVAQTVERLPTMRETWVQFLGQEDLLEKEMATPSSILVWKIPRTEEPGRLQPMGLQRVGHDWTTVSFTIYFTNGDFFWCLIILFIIMSCLFLLDTYLWEFFEVLVDLCLLLPTPGGHS